MKRLVLLLSLLSLCFSTCTFNFGETQEDQDNFWDVYGQSMDLVVAAILFSVVLTSLAYMAGKAANSPELLVFSQESLIQVVVSVILVLIMFSFLEGTCQFTSLFLQESQDPIQASMQYAQSLKSQGSAIISQLYARSLDEKFAGAYMVGYYSVLVGGETSFPSTYHNAKSRQYEIMIDLVNVGFVSAGVQYFLVQSIMGFVFPVLVPFGLFLRALPFLREVGNTVLAIAFALIIIFPFAYAVNAFAVDSASGLGGEGTTSLENIANYMLQTIFLPNLALVVTITGATAMIKAAKVIP